MSATWAATASSRSRSRSNSSRRLLPTSLDRVFSMSTTAVRSAAEFEEQLQRYLYERSEEGRAVRVGEKEVSEQAAIVARYADVFSREQLEALREEEHGSDGERRGWFYRLRKTCESGLVAAELAERDDELENAQLAGRVKFKDEELPLRAALAQLSVIPEYKDRDELGELYRRRSADFNEQRLDLIRAYEELEADLSGEPDPIARNEEEKQISLRELESVLVAASEQIEPGVIELREEWFERLLGPRRGPQPSSAHMGYVRRLSPPAATDTKDRATEVCLQTLSALGFDLAADQNIKLDLDDRPQKSPRACVIASDPPKVVHLITRAQGGLHDYQAFMHEAGHALHYAGVDASLPYTFRRICRDHALTEIYSYICEAITREPGWHAEYFDLNADEAATNAQATVFLEALLFRRYTAKLQFELGFWSSFEEAGTTSEDYAKKLTAATGVRYHSDGHLADMDAGLYSADYLRAWIRHAQLRAQLVQEIGEDWWRSRETGEILRRLFAEGTRPTSEEIAGRLGFEAFDTRPLVGELNA